MQKSEKIFPINMRIAQFYMARHKVSMFWAEQFIDHAAECGFNYINLCIYGCIRTEIFHHMPESKSYSKEEISHLVNYAARYGIEIIPNYELFSHAESFLECPEFEHLCELRDGKKGRFSDLKESFCPSLDETYQFIEGYLRETSELFPSQYINAGLDENFDIAICPLCAEWAEKMGRAEIQKQHVIRIHDIIVNKLGKTMMMWDDSLEFYPEAFDNIPRDIIMLSWWYDRKVPAYAHLGGPKINCFDFHEKHGFRYIGVPATYNFQNIESYTDFAKKYNPMGMLLSNWGMMTRFNSFPMMNYASYLWKDGISSDEAQKKCVLHFTAPENETELELLRFYFREGEHEKLPAQPAAYANGELSCYEYQKVQLARALLPLVNRKLAEADSAKFHHVLYEMQFNLRSELWYYQLRRILSKWSDPKADFTQWDELKALREEIRIANDELKAFFDTEYSTPIPEFFTVTDVVVMLEKIIDRSIKRPSARIRISYPARYGLGALEFLIRSKQDRNWKSLGKSYGQSLYGYYQDCTESEEYLFIDDSVSEVDKLKILYTESTGGVCGYAACEFPDSDYIPESIIETAGKVTSPENLLTEGRYHSFFGDGERLTIEKNLHPFVHEENYVILKMKKVIAK